MHRKIAAMPQAAVAADLHEPLDIHGDLLAEIALDAALLLEHTADLADVVFRQVLDADIRAHARRSEDVVRALASNAVDVGEPDLDPLGPRKVNACDTCHSCLIPVAACASRSCRSRAPRRVCERSCICHKCASPTLVLSLSISRGPGPPNGGPYARRNRPVSRSALHAFRTIRPRVRSRGV